VNRRLAILFDRLNIKQKLNLKSAPERIRYVVRWIESGSASGP